MSAIVPVPRVGIAIRVATMADIPFMDGLQKKYGKALGYFPTQQFEGYVQSGGVLVAEEIEPQRHRDTEARSSDDSASVSPCLCGDPVPKKLGYVISRDRYLKRDELGVVFQLCVEPGTQRKLVGAALVREVFARSAYGCRLYCCWCAQDLEANRFWESMGFLPIAFRTGSDKKRRVHIYWQRRIVEGDTTTPYWYPSLTNQGAIREDRLVFPIPPGMHWSEVRAVELNRRGETCLALSEGDTSVAPTAAASRSKQTTKNKPQTTKNTLADTTRVRGLRFGAIAVEKAKPVRAKRETVKACPEQRRRIDPKHVKAARELRDRYLERLNGERLNGEGSDASLALAEPKYAVARALEDARSPAATSAVHLLPAA